MKKSFMVFVVGVFILIPTRIYEYKNTIDGANGFYNEHHVSRRIGISVIIICFLLMAIFTKRSRIMERPFENGASFLGVSFSAVGIVLIGIFLNNLLPLFREPRIEYKTLVYVGTGLFTGVVFLIIGLKFILLRIQDTFMRALMLVPIIWSISMLWRTFIGYQIILTVSEHVYDVVSYILVALGFLYLAYVTSGFGAIQHQKKMVVFGLTGSMICITNAVGKMYSAIRIDGENLYSLMELGYILDFSIGILLMIACGYICFGTDRHKKMIYSKYGEQ